MSVTVTAPGKLFLSGEYAVLEGAPGIVAAVDRRVVARPAPGSDPMPEVRLAAAYMAKRLDVGGTPVAIAPAVDASALCLEGRKLGLGSSAAAAVAAAGAVAVRCGRADGVAASPQVLFEVAAQAHADAQGGGSGADVAASAFGGVIRFTRGQPVTRARISAPLHLVVAWTGAPARTSDLLRRALDAGLPAAAREAAEAMATALAAGDGAALEDATALHVRALGEIAARTGCPLMTEGLSRFVARARALGVPAKPSGAGGGDLGVAFAPDGEAAAALREALSADGHLVLDVDVDHRGVAMEEE